MQTCAKSLDDARTKYGSSFSEAKKLAKILVHSIRSQSCISAASNIYQSARKCFQKSKISRNDDDKPTRSLVKFVLHRILCLAKSNAAIWQDQQRGPSQRYMRLATEDMFGYAVRRRDGLD